MRPRNPFVQAIAIVIAAMVVAVVANGFSSPQRRLLLPGFWPNARRVPPRVPEPVAPPPVTETIAPVTTTTAAPVPPSTATATVAPPVLETTTTATITAAPAPPPKTVPAVDPLTRFQPHADKAYVEIGGDDAELLHHRGVLFLDARRTSAYEEGHIAGARPFSVWEADVDEKVNKLFEERSDPAEQNKPIVIYCTGGACEDSHMLAQKLWGIQFNNVYVYKDGFPDWQQRRGPVRTGANP